MRRIGIAIALGVTLTASGCATIAGGGTSQSFSVRAQPTSAEFIVRRGDGTEVASGRAPQQVMLRRQHSHTIEVRADGYQPQTVALERRLNKWVWFNLVFGGVIGFIVDFTNGAAYTIDPSFVEVRMVASDTGAEAHLLLRDEAGRELRTIVLPMVPVQ